jgi:hypothetical protein
MALEPVNAVGDDETYEGVLAFIVPRAASLLETLMASVLLFEEIIS